jgi:hypothetical protein
LSESLDFALTARLREVLANEPATEAELRTLSERAVAWERMLQGQLQASERRLEQLTVDPAGALGEIGAELHRVSALGPQLTEARSLLVDLERRTRALRSEWLSRQAEPRKPSTSGGVERPGSPAPEPDEREPPQP